MDEVLVRGLIIGAVFMAFGVTANLIWKLVKSRSEGARRFKWVIGAVLTFMIAAMIVQSLGVTGLLLTLLALGALVWIVLGFKAKP